ncbi:tRNA glutamyl-Q(34) synthetase GluQRS [Pseudidiomarina andamanensis]|uniref:Glutamyl-Q tRNA(Asp) synthetase n=1 Tax=Pseudidiomarina andamanensis TaxID=1940690 RepID=A0AA92ETA3_9GAMM|nr:tRNA glutamyl-Q(34) synthetase GluQRS [Pseudidiomarina andamanensis]MDS0219481.1 tRNA glutamyl-Q(34) synthetase GluQRS [Pseudidiomarina andamanensis]QGT95884.1 tRNA glutamyl-Q(34) synthetase GluQRS [Pseudidiomarina andamanensis]
MAASFPYCGRFAPTPSGPLHFGSLIAALASYLDARANAGTWLVRIEDIDTPRAVAGADNIILEQLKHHELHWDGDIWYQSKRTEIYQQAIKQLEDQHLTYRCECTRKQIKALGPYYTGTCRNKNITAADTAIRFRNDDPIFSFDDGWQGHIKIDPPFAGEDFVLFRRDGLFTYQLAVVVDDIEQGVTDIVRGEDLLTATSWQLNLWRYFTERVPRFKHVPLALDDQGRKLSKQNHAPALNNDDAKEQLQAAMTFLGLTPSRQLSVPQLLAEAVTQWQARSFPETSQQDTI